MESVQQLATAVKSVKSVKSQSSPIHHGSVCGVHTGEQEIHRHISRNWTLTLVAAIRRRSNKLTVYLVDYRTTHAALAVSRRKSNRTSSRCCVRSTRNQPPSKRPQSKSEAANSVVRTWMSWTDRPLSRPWPPVTGITLNGRWWHVYDNTRSRTGTTEPPGRRSARQN